MTMPSDADTRPLYLQVKEGITARIRSGEWAPGFRVPSENQLVRELKISRMTINRALRELKDEGYLARVHGVGTFVRELPRQASLIELKNIAEEVHQRGGIYSNHVRALEEVTAATKLAQQFELAPRARLFHITVVHEENGEPVQVEDRFVNPEIAPEFLEQDFSKVTPTKYMLSIAPVEALEHVVSARMPDDHMRHLLAIDEGEPCLVLNRRSWSQGQVATVTTLTYPASRYELRAHYRTSAAGTISGPAPTDTFLKEVV